MSFDIYRYLKNTSLIALKDISKTFAWDFLENLMITFGRDFRKGLPFHESFDMSFRVMTFSIGLSVFSWPWKAFSWPSKTYRKIRFSMCLSGSGRTSLSGQSWDFSICLSGSWKGNPFRKSLPKVIMRFSWESHAKVIQQANCHFSHCNTPQHTDTNCNTLQRYTGFWKSLQKR